MNRLARLAKLEGGKERPMSEAVRAWLGLRPPLTVEEQAAHDAELREPVDLSRLSPEAREWLSR